MKVTMNDYCSIHDRPFEVFFVGGAVVYGCPECRPGVTVGDRTDMTAWDLEKRAETQWMAGNENPERADG